MAKFTREDHSINRTLESLDYDPAVIAGLTGNELFGIALVLQGLSLLIIVPLVGLLTGIWSLAFGLAMITGVLSIGIVARRVGKQKEIKPADIVWLDYKIKLINFLNSTHIFNLDPGVFTEKESWSCERVKK